MTDSSLGATGRSGAPRQQAITLTMADGTMGALDLGDPDRPFDLVFLHANGFNARTYLGLLEPLSHNWRVLALDLRGHGTTRLPTETRDRRNWADMQGDVLHALHQIDAGRVVLAGHSMGGSLSILIGASAPERVARIVAIDPVVWPRLMTVGLNLPGVSRLAARTPLVSGALRRRNGFSSPQSALQGWRGRGAFTGWPDAVLQDYVADAIEKGEDGRWHLTCPPAWEASNYAAQAQNVWRAAARASQPIRVLRAERGSTCFFPEGDSHGGRMSVTRVPGTTHFMPMLSPEPVRSALIAALQSRESV